MSISNNLTWKELPAIMTDRAQRILDMFNEATVEGVGHLILPIMLEVNTYWNDILRPALTSFCCEAVGGQKETVINVSLMIALVSAGGGIHDDIIDKSTKKNFRDTIFGLHGLDHSLLAGDLLILKGWGKLEEVIGHTGQPEKIMEVVGIFRDWTIEVLESEFLESLCRRNLDADLKHYLTILWKSTADMEACARIGAIFGDGSDTDVRSLAKFGRRLGFGFRLANEVKDIYSMKLSLIHRLENESVPLPILYAAKSSTDNYRKVKSILEKPNISPTDISKLLEVCYEAKAFTYILEIAKENTKKAKEFIKGLQPSSALQALQVLADKALDEVATLCQ